MASSVCVRHNLQMYLYNCIQFTDANPLCLFFYTFFIVDEYLEVRSQNKVNKYTSLAAVKLHFQHIINLSLRYFSGNGDGGSGTLISFNFEIQCGGNTSVAAAIWCPYLFPSPPPPHSIRQRGSHLLDFEQSKNYVFLMLNSICTSHVRNTIPRLMKKMSSFLLRLFTIRCAVEVNDSAFHLVPLENIRSVAACHLFGSKAKLKIAHIKMNMRAPTRNVASFWKLN